VEKSRYVAAAAMWGPTGQSGLSVVPAAAVAVAHGLLQVQERPMQSEHVE